MSATSTTLKGKTQELLVNHGRAALTERCPTCGAPVKTIFSHVDGCPHEKRTSKRNRKHKGKS